MPTPNAVIVTMGSSNSTEANVIVENFFSANGAPSSPLALLIPKSSGLDALVAGVGIFTSTSGDTYNVIITLTYDGVGSVVAKVAATRFLS